MQLLGRELRFEQGLVEAVAASGGELGQRGGLEPVLFFVLSEIDDLCDDPVPSQSNITQINLSLSHADHNHLPLVNPSELILIHRIHSHNHIAWLERMSNLAGVPQQLLHDVIGPFLVLHPDHFGDISILELECTPHLQVQAIEPLSFLVVIQDIHPIVNVEEVGLLGVAQPEPNSLVLVVDYDADQVEGVKGEKPARGVALRWLLVEDLEGDPEFAGFGEFYQGVVHDADTGEDVGAIQELQDPSNGVLVPPVYLDLDPRMYQFLLDQIGEVVVVVLLDSLCLHRGIERVPSVREFQEIVLFLGDPMNCHHNQVHNTPLLESPVPEGEPEGFLDRLQLLEVLLLELVDDVEGVELLVEEMGVVLGVLGEFEDHLVIPFNELLLVLLPVFPAEKRGDLLVCDAGDTLRAEKTLRVLALFPGMLEMLGFLVLRQIHTQITELGEEGIPADRREAGGILYQIGRLLDGDRFAIRVIHYQQFLEWLAMALESLLLNDYLLLGLPFRRESKRLLY